jgi:hypothetical protein
MSSFSELSTDDDDDHLLVAIQTNAWLIKNGSLSLNNLLSLLGAFDDAPS